MKIMVLDNCGDDAECGVGGTSALLTKTGHEVIIGRFNKPNALNNRSAALLGAKEEWLEFPENEPAKRIDTPAHAEKLTKFLLKHKADIIFTYWPVDEHYGHRAVATMTIRCVNDFYYKALDVKGNLHPGEYCPELYFYEVISGKQTKCFQADTYIDVTEVIELKKQAMLVYKPAEGQDQTYFNSWYPHQLLMLEFRGRESGAIRHAQIDRGIYAEAFIHFPMPPGSARLLLPGMK
jgi:LmbE family N-acetylglucosaminyl deacetylase